MNINISRMIPRLMRKQICSLNRQISCRSLIFTQDKQDHQQNNFNKFFKYTVGGVVSFAFGFSFIKNDEDKNNNSPSEFGLPRSDLPFYKMKDVEKHTTKDDGIWVTYSQGVYDITNFIDEHPGGNIILLAAGGSLDPFWNLYGIHKQKNVLRILEKFRIGNLDKEDVKQEVISDDPYAWEPRRHPALKPSSVKPFNAEPPSSILIQNFSTPQELFYVRNHFPVPDVDSDSYELEITGIGFHTKTFTLEDIKKMTRSSISATIMCAGNRRSEMSQVKPVKGLNWGHAAVGNAVWTGVKLSDLLSELGITEDCEAQHVQFEGLDTDITNTPYGASIPLTTALDPKKDVLLAYEMNGEPLSRDHGFPIRVVVPGIVGARNVKWLSKIIISKNESEAHWQQRDYKGFCPSVDWDSVDFSKSPAIQELPVISAICVPTDGDTVMINRDNTVTVKGYAWSGGGRAIIRVDLTCDEGLSWQTADLFVEKKSIPGHYVWDWTLWEAKLPLPPNIKDKMSIWVKAVDSAYNTQPESFSNIWNLRGVLNNAYHRVQVKITK